jgi:hypothetical protein
VYYCVYESKRRRRKKGKEVGESKKEKNKMNSCYAM